MKFLQDIDVTGKTVLLRLNLNVPIKNGKITDDFRIKAVLPTIDYLKDRAKKVLIAAHLGRPEGRDKNFTLRPIGDYLKRIYGDRFSFLFDCIGDDVKQAVDNARDGTIILLENVRYHKGERKNDQAMGKALAKLADVYVNDAFGDSYEPYASVVWPPEFIPAVGGLRLQKEMEALDRLKSSPKHPFVVLIGGIKIAEKMGTIKRLSEKADHVLVGGGIGNTMLAASGIDVHESLVQEAEMKLAEELIASLRGKLVLPTDVRVASKLSDGSIDKKSLRFTKVSEIRAGEAIFDIGPETVLTYSGFCRDAADVFWAGPLGYIEWDLTATGSIELAKLLADLPNYCVVGGGETASLLAPLGLIEKMDFVSTGGGAALKFLSGEPLPGLVALR